MKKNNRLLFYGLSCLVAAVITGLPVFGNFVMIRDYEPVIQGFVMSCILSALWSWTVLGLPALFFLTAFFGLLIFGTWLSLAGATLAMYKLVSKPTRNSKNIQKRN